ncbi:ABC transporter permease subunit [Bacillus atrophaeus]|uniref:ABC transporter permease n=1 Tax=Bacillus atrophaeus TaxID=1452 RepID=UPI002282AA29|nr:ABC transporter permease subunit [Bacillus atrophaeus]MCY8836373.1 ABC transporter permease [Bacillus atrophaeus]MCY8961180.1 ABC transporter permease [Bacillus atrophaeus]MCY8962870.1 ABC transporter permease [Bacillus atrophaeus]MCY9438325.1 ABC transporter permease [Bacillus atrophaeus]MEC0651138.1 ABC transporter permease subunit [Bacillus atrophaeus]
MKTCMVLLKKEWFEALKSGRLIWLPIAMMIVGLTQPLSLYYMPEIIENAGNLPDGVAINFTMPSGNEVMISTLSQFSVLGTALLIFSVMGSVANERNQGVLALIMSRPVPAVYYILSKWIVHSVIGAGSFAAGYGLAYYYVHMLFDGTDSARFLSSLGVYSLWVVFVMTAGLLGSTVFRSIGAAAAAGIGLVAAVSLAVSLSPDHTVWLPSVLRAQADHMLLHGDWSDFFGWTLAASVLCIVVLAALSVWCFRRYKTY